MRRGTFLLRLRFGRPVGLLLAVLGFLTASNHFTLQIAEGSVPLQVINQMSQSSLSKKSSHPPKVSKSDIDLLAEKALSEDDKGIGEIKDLYITEKDILDDKANRIPEEFKVPPSLEARVRFWFEVYTKFGSNINIIHHSEYPWIIYDFVDIGPIMAANKDKSNKWTKFHKSERLLEKRKGEIKKALLELAKHPTAKKHSALAERMAIVLSEIPGSRKSVYLFAAKSMRSQMGQRDFFKRGLISSSKYLPQMEEIFARYDLPLELTRLPLVESSFNENAISKVGASGIWQFMPGTGKKKKLKVEDNIDERNSPIKATEAAAHLMLENFRIFKSWPLALTSYNHGAGSLLKELRRSSSRELGVLIRDIGAQKFGFASSNFYPSFLAALHAEQYQNEVFGEIPKAIPLEVDSIRLKFAVQAKRLIDQAGMTIEELRLYNPELRRSVKSTTRLPKGFNLHVPIGRAPRIELFEFAKKGDIVSKKSKRSSPIGIDPVDAGKKVSRGKQASRGSVNGGGFDPYGSQEYLAKISKEREYERQTGELSSKKVIHITFDE